MQAESKRAVEGFPRPVLIRCPPPASLLLKAVRLLLSRPAALLLADSGRTDQAEKEARTEQYLTEFGSNILRFAYSYLHNQSDAEEVLQETMIRFWTCQPVFENEIHAKAWFLRVAANLSKNRLRYNRFRTTDELGETLAEEEREDLSFVWEAVKSLPVKYRESIHLFYQEGYSTPQIARILGQKEATVRSHLQRGRMRLKEILKEEYDFEDGI